jgi:hypothetical protein
MAEPEEQTEEELYEAVWTNDRDRVMRLVEQGFEYVCDFEGGRVFRKEKPALMRRKALLYEELKKQIRGPS